MSFWWWMKLRWCFYLKCLVIEVFARRSKILQTLTCFRVNEATTLWELWQQSLMMATSLSCPNFTRLSSNLNTRALSVNDILSQKHLSIWSWKYLSLQRGCLKWIRFLILCPIPLKFRFRPFVGDDINPKLSSSQNVHYYDLLSWLKISIWSSTSWK